MAIVNTNWQQFLNHESELPADVYFSVEDQRAGNLSRSDDSKTVLVGAHKLLLAGISPVFRKQFFGPMQEKTDIVVIKETTIEAFNTMISYIYMAPGRNTFSIKDIVCPQVLFELLNISERYQILCLIKIVKDVLKNLPITAENMIFAAATAKNYAVFEDVSKLLMESCQAFLTNKLKSAEDVFSFLLLSKEKFPDADPDLIYELMRANAEKKKLELGLLNSRKRAQLSLGAIEVRPLTLEAELLSRSRNLIIDIMGSD